MMEAGVAVICAYASSFLHSYVCQVNLCDLSRNYTQYALSVGYLQSILLQLNFIITFSLDLDLHSVARMPLSQFNFL